jgi:hypothetical protein
MNGGTLVVELPAGVEPTAYDTVSIRCVVGSLDFGSARLAASP